MLDSPWYRWPSVSQSVCLQQHWWSTHLARSGPGSSASELLYIYLTTLFHCLLIVSCVYFLCLPSDRFLITIALEGIAYLVYNVFFSSLFGIFFSPFNVRIIQAIHTDPHISCIFLSFALSFTHTHPLPAGLDLQRVNYQAHFGFSGLIHSPS